jgi:hypothetical protein
MAISTTNDGMNSVVDTLKCKASCRIGTEYIERSIFRQRVVLCIVNQRECFSRDSG